MSGTRHGDGIALSVVIPAYNEVQRLDAAAQRLREAVDAGGVNPKTTEFIVIDDGSSDETGERAAKVLADYPITVVHRLVTNAGKGAAVRAGFALARAPVTAFMDADMAVDPVQLAALVDALDTSEIAIGSRSVPGSSVTCDSMPRTVMGRTFNRLVNLATHVSLGDTQCGFKAFRTPVGRLLFHLSVIDRFAFDVELLYLARRFGLSIAEVPVRWSHITNSRIRPLRDPASMVYDVVASRLGLKPPPPVNGAFVAESSGTVSPPPGARQALAECAWRIVGPTLPVMPDHPSGALVLFPLCPQADVDALIDKLSATLPRTTITPTSLGANDLATLAPLRVLFGPNPPAAPETPGAAGTRGRGTGPGNSVVAGT